MGDRIKREIKSAFQILVGVKGGNTKKKKKSGKPGVKAPGEIHVTIPGEIHVTISARS